MKKTKNMTGFPYLMSKQFLKLNGCQASKLTLCYQWWQHTVRNSTTLRLLQAMC